MSEQQFQPQFYLGVVEDRHDPMKLGRARVRVFGIHTHDKTKLPTEDLPWAYKVQPTNSGSISGIGIAPVGVVEGTWVVVQYIDPERQMPFIVGTLGGIPQSKNPELETYELIEGSVSVPASSPGENDTTTPPEGSTDSPATPPTEPSSPPQRPIDSSYLSWKQDVKRRLGELESNNRYGAVNTLGFVGKYQFGTAALIETGYVKPGTKTLKGHAALDDPSVWTGKNGVKSKQDWLANQAAQESAMDSLMEKNYNTLKRIGVPIDTLPDQEKGGLIAASHLVGPGGAKKYYNGIDSADAYGSTASKYYKEGYKAVSGKLPTEGSTPSKDPAPANPPTAGGGNSSGSTAPTPSNPVPKESKSALRYGYQIDTKKFEDKNNGFKDPNGLYPFDNHLDEPDTNRLARHEKIRQTIVYQKEKDREKEIKIANEFKQYDNDAWDQPPIPYNAEYPYNNVTQSESGHIFELDDTPGSERIHLYHRKGTFLEIDHNGTQVNRIVGDGYEILDRNGFVYVKGNAHVSVDGTKSLLVKDTLQIEVYGKANIHCREEINVLCSNDINIQSSYANLNVAVAGDVNVSAKGNMNFDADGNITMKASRIDLNPGAPSTIEPKKLEPEGGKPVITKQLNVFTSADRIAQLYEVMPDDPPSQRQSFVNKFIEEGIADSQEEIDAGVPSVPPKENVTPPPAKEAPPFSCDIPLDKKDFTGNEQLSKYFKLVDVTAGYQRKLVDQNGLKAAEIFCNLKNLAINVLDPIREKYPNMRINSGFRLGTSNSQHNKGQAVDISFAGVSRAELYNVILEIQKLIPYDQLILEYNNPGGNGWIHISYNGKANRKQIFTMVNHKRVSRDLYSLANPYGNSKLA